MRTLRGSAISDRGFESNRRFVDKAGVEAVGIVDVFDEGADAAAGVFEVGVGRAVGFLGFERLHEAL